MIRRFTCIAVGLLLGVPCGPGFGQSPSPTQDDKIKTRVTKALELIKAGSHEAAVSVLDPVVKARPDLAKVRLLRAKALLAQSQLDRADEDVQAVLAIQPDLEPALGLARKIREARSEQAVVMQPKTTYSEWERFWRIDGKTSFKLDSFKAPEGVTAFYFPARPKDDAEIEPYRADADAEVFFLRVVDLKGAGDTADLSLPPVKDLSVLSVPWLILVDVQGTVVARGSPQECGPKLDALRKEAQARIAARQPKKPANTDPVSTADWATSEDGVESLGSPGYVSIVMVTSPG